MSNTGKLVVFSGFSGSGKGTIMKELMAKHGDDYALSVSATTRGQGRVRRMAESIFLSQRKNLNR